MNKLILTFLVLIGFSNALNAQLLWKISGKGLKNPSYLFGTHHLIPTSFLDSVPGLFKAFNSCNTVVGEMVTSNIEGTVRIQQAAVMPNHIKISDLLDSEEFALVDKELRATLKFSLGDVAALNPALLLTMYELELYKKQTGYKESIPLDSYFQIIAEEKEREVIGLETVDQQISFLFGSKDMERQADILIESVRNKDKLLKEIVKMNALYKSGAVNELVKLAKGSGDAYSLTEEEYVKLVDKRNAAWLTKLPDMMTKSSCFIAVGAMHLGGANGLVKQLQKAGYKVKAVK